MKKTLPLLALLATLIPVTASAANILSGISEIGSVIRAITSNIVSALIVLFATAAVAAFFFGLVRFIWASREGKPEEIKVGQKFMLWGLVALFVMFSVWGIIGYAQRILGLGGGTSLNQMLNGGGAPTPTPGLSPSSSSGEMYECPNGSKYYNIQDRDTACGLGTGSGGGSTANCTTITNQSSCTGSCTWHVDFGCVVR